MISLSVPRTINDLLFTIQEIIRRAIDGTVVPLIVDRTNQRVLVGTATAATSSGGKLEVSGNIRIQGNANGVFLANANGTIYKLYIDTDGAIRADQQ